MRKKDGEEEGRWRRWREDRGSGGQRRQKIEDGRTETEEEEGKRETEGGRWKGGGEEREGN